MSKKKSATIAELDSSNQNLNKNKERDFYSKTMSFFSYTCHQNAKKSFFIGKYQMPFCARCFGIYVGTLFGILFSALFFKSYMILLFVSLGLLFMMLFDWILQNGLNLYFSNITRFISGIMAGTATIMFLTAMIMLIIS